MRTTIAIITIFLIAAAVGADTIRIGKLSYSDVRVVKVENGRLYFRSGSPRLIGKELSQVVQISVSGRPTFNRAEQLLADGKAAEAVESYDLAILEATSWLSKLIRHRRMAAMDRGGQFPRATKEWLSLVGAYPEETELLERRPTNLPARDSPENPEAVRLLQEALKRAETGSGQAKAINELLARLRGAAAGKAKYQRPGGQADARRVSSANLRGFESIRKLIDQGQGREALAQLRANIRVGRYSRKLLPQALLLSARTARRLADTAQEVDKRKLLLSAGLDFMRVAAFFEENEVAADALLGAAEINVELGNRWAAATACQVIMRDYSTSDAARRASKTLEAIRRRSEH